MLGRRGNRGVPPPEWSRQKMLALLIGVGVLAVVLVVGLVLAVVYAITPSAGHAADQARASGDSGRGGTGAQVSGPAIDPRDALANRAMPKVGEDASHPGPVSTANPGTPILLPAPTGSGPAQVPTGFPHTAVGAMAQLAAIDQVALQSGSLAGARAVIRGWTAPGGPTESSWSVVQGLVALFSETGLSGGGSSQLAIVLTPLMGQIKGSVGPDFVVPCIDFELDITFAQTARGATADCQRMVWSRSRTRGRWLIGPGPEPATPPSVWPDTDTAIAVGYKDLRQEPHS
jgi:hypothetical protein